MALNAIRMLIIFHIFIPNPTTPLNLGRMTPTASPTISNRKLLGNAHFKSPEPNSGYPPQLLLPQPSPS